MGSGTEIYNRTMDGKWYQDLMIQNEQRQRRLSNCYIIPAMAENVSDPSR